MADSTSTDFAPPLSADQTKVAVNVQNANSVSVALPSGSIIAFGGAVAPAGYVLCDGSTYDGTTATYQNLYAAIGLAYGGLSAAGFKVPDLRGRVIVGYAPSGGHTDVSTLGNNDGVAEANRRPKHRHTPHTHAVGSPVALNNVAGGSADFGAGSHSTAGIVSTDGGSGVATDSLDAPAYLVSNYIIAL